MEKSNFALISALYSSSNHGLYSDIYFPIIKYALVGLFSNREKSHPYCNASEIHDYILNKFGISIPQIVISKSIQKINIQKWGNIQLNVYENGEIFQIQSATFEIDEEIVEREKLFTEKIEIIEEKYQAFIEQECSINDGITFIQFISDNTDDILGYFEEQDTSKVNERYATMVFFLQYLSDNEKDLYQFANQLFWGSVIAGFLRSEKPHVDESEDGIHTEYFLDTSIVMGVLQLSTPQREAYSKDVCDIIQAAGGILRINPMTVDEISLILQSVEQNGPNPMTDIASACERRNLEANELARIRINLVTEIENKGISVFPQMNFTEKQKLIRYYKGKKVTKLLTESRTKRPASYSSDNYREIHDVYMDDYIKERRVKKGNDNHVFFLTANRDLVGFCKAMHPMDNYMKSTGQIILELWMHNTKPVDISGCMLTETMARCLDLHSTKVRNKIAEVSRLYNKTKSDFDANIYKDFIKKLYSRAKHVIQTVEVDPDKIIESEFGRLIKEAVTADNLAYDKESAKVRNENVLLTESIASKSIEVERLTSDNKKKQAEITAITEDRDKLSSEKEEIERKRQMAEKERNQAIKEKEKAEKINYLYKRRDELKDLIEHTKADLIPFEKTRDKSFCNWLPFFFFAISAVLIICIFILWALSSFSKDYLESNSGIFSLGLPLVAIFVSVGLHYNTNDSIEKRKTNAHKKWEAKNENKKYTLLLKDLNKYNEELKTIKDKLISLM